MKHREFWITMHRNEYDVLLPLHAFFSSNKAFNERAEETILVIDRKAYEELEAENARLKEKRQVLRRYHGGDGTVTRGQVMEALEE